MKTQRTTTAFLAGFAACAATLLLLAANPNPVGPEYDTLADLLAHQPPQGVAAKWYNVKGWTTIGDGFAGDMYYQAGSVTATNADSIFAWSAGRLFKVSGGLMLSGTNNPNAAPVVTPILTRMHNTYVQTDATGVPTTIWYWLPSATSWK